MTAMANLLDRMKNENEETRKAAAVELKNTVESASHEMSSETFTKFMNELTPKIFLLVQSVVVHEQLGGIQAIDQLIDVSSEDDEAKIIRFSNYLRNFFVQPHTSKIALERAAKALGHLARAGGTLTADFVEFEVKRALEWLQGEQHDMQRRRLAACLILKELAINAPTLFYVNVSQFFDSIWAAIRDRMPEIRKAAANALRACLRLISHRHTRYRVQWYCKIYEQVFRGFASNSVEAVHGSLLIVGEMLQCTGDFMIPRFKEVCDTVLRYKDCRDVLVRRTVSSLLPQLAKFCPDAFVRGYLDTCLDYLIKAVQNMNERSTAYSAIGKLSIAVGYHIVRQLDTIIGLVKDGMIVKRSRPFCTESLYCVASLAQAVGNAMLPYMNDLLDQMLRGGLNNELIIALADVAKHIPSCLVNIQARLMNEVSMILQGAPFQPPGSDILLDVHQPITQLHTTPVGQPVMMSFPPGLSSTEKKLRIASGHGSAKARNFKNSPLSNRVVLLALETLANFNFDGVALLPFMRCCVTLYLDHENVAVRLQSAKTCSKLLPSVIKLSAASSSVRFRGPTADIIAGVLERLLVAGISDPSSSVREAVVLSLNASFDDYLCHPYNLKFLFTILNDEEFKIREASVSVVGRLATKNPAYVMPALRKMLLQLLTELKYTTDGKAKEESTKLLGHVIRSSQRLVKPFLAPVLDVLLPKLQEGNSILAGAVLLTIGELAMVAGSEISMHEKKLLPLIVDTLQDHSSSSKRGIAMRTLGQLVGSTGLVVQPYLQFKNLLNVSLELLHHGAGAPWELRRETLKTLGILGALDPYKYKCCQIRAKQKHSLIEQHSATVKAGSYISIDPNGASGTVGFRDNENTTDFFGGESLSITHEKEKPHSTQLTPSSEDYYPTVVISALMRILRDPTLSIHHYGVIQAVMFIFKSLGMRCVPFLEDIIPPFLDVMKNCEHGLRESLFQQLANLVSIVKQHLRSFLDPIFELIEIYWDENLENILTLVEEISTALPADLRVQMPRIISLILRAIDVPDNKGSRLSIDAKLCLRKLKVLHAIVILGPAVREYLYLLVPALLQFLGKVPDTTRSHQIPLKAATLEAVGRLGQSLGCFVDYTSRIMHALILILREGSGNILLQISLDVLCAAVHHLQLDFLVFKATIEKVLQDRINIFKKLKSYEQYQVMISSLQRKASSTSRMSKPVSGASGPQPYYQYLSAPCGANSSMTDKSQPNVDGGSLINHSSFLGSLPGRQIGNPTSAFSATIPDDLAVGKTLHVNQQNLRRAWEASQRSTKEDWSEWMRRFSVELLRESPSPSLRSCSALAQVYHPLAKELFNAAFVSCWAELYEQYQDYLVRSLETAFQSDTIPPEILQNLLNLAEFMEHDVEALPIDIRVLGELAEKCHAYAKALHYKELEFHTSPSTCIEALISINNQLGQPEAAVGILKYAQQHHASVIEVKESWFEKLQNWKEALDLYRARHADEPTNFDATAGMMRCLEAIGDWQELSELCQEVWHGLCDDGVGALPAEHLSSPLSRYANLSLTGEFTTPFGEQGENKTTTRKAARHEVALLAARASWSLGDWVGMEKYVDAANAKDTQISLYRAVIAVHNGNYDSAKLLVDETRKKVDQKLAALVGESYDRAYQSMVTVQQLAELEEIIRYKRLRSEVRNIDEASRYRKHLMSMWKSRLTGCKRSVKVWQQLLAVRSLIVTPHEDIDTWLQFSSLCRQSGNLTWSLKVLTSSLGVTGVAQQNPIHGDGGLSINRPMQDDSSSGFSGTSLGFGESEHRRVSFAYIKHLWATDQYEESIESLKNLVTQIGSFEDPLAVKCHLKLGEWQLAFGEQNLAVVDIESVLCSFKTATQLDDKSYKAWHAWALMNFQVVEYFEQLRQPTAQIIPHIVPAVQGFFKSISLGRNRWTANVQQDILRLLTLWFAHGHRVDVHDALLKGFEMVSIDTWLGVIPQLIARIHTPHPQIQRQLHQLLSSIGAKHPQSLIYPLSVALKSPLQVRQVAAEAIMSILRRHFEQLVDQALLVSKELIRVAILWHEMWHEGLEEASRLYFGLHNIDDMFAVLEPLHEMMALGPQTLREVSFQQTFGKELGEAYDWIKKYKRSAVKSDSDLNHAWDLYYHVFRRINKQLPQLTTLELQYVSPALMNARNLELAVPGTYHPGASSVIKIASFVPTISVITSKQRPRKITIAGNNGLDYVFLLKGHEDLRQDERVMQLFGLVNALLMNDRTTSKRDLKIQRYSVIPLSPNAGIVGWVPNCDTLHQLIRDYREARKILLNIEHRLMLQMAPDFDSLGLMQKVEVFEYALENTAGQDLYKVLWLKSKNSEIWLDRRTNYTRSLAVMSMVGYILGLGDRHPSNLMLDRFTGTIVHIDFGDCFEVAMHREKFPERIPFRLTRMLTNAMEVSGIEGNFRYSCESVMRVLRENRDSLMAMLEAFVHDPLICWRLLAPTNSISYEYSPRVSQSMESNASENSQMEERYDDEIFDSPSNAAFLMQAEDVNALCNIDDDIPSYSLASTSLPVQVKHNTRNRNRLKPGIEDVNDTENRNCSSYSMRRRGSSIYSEIANLASSTRIQGDSSFAMVHTISSTEGNLDPENASLSASARSSVHAANRSNREKELVHALGPEGADAPREALNQKAVAVIHRVQAKLKGRDFDDEHLDVSAQVQRLINQATSHENLCQCYIGWCPFW